LLGDIYGTDLVKCFRDEPNLRSIPVIAATAAVLRGDEERFRESGFWDVPGIRTDDYRRDTLPMVVWRSSS
jgi:CheY-like chemotaxis protein